MILISSGINGKNYFPFIFVQYFEWEEIEQPHKTPKSHQIWRKQSEASSKKRIKIWIWIISKKGEEKHEKYNEKSWIKMKITS